jgi:hypothetical protein
MLVANNIGVPSEGMDLPASRAQGIEPHIDARRLHLGGRVRDLGNRRNVRPAGFVTSAAGNLMDESHRGRTR